MQGFYAATKAALDALTRVMAAEWAADGIRVNSLALGSYRSDMFDAATRLLPGFEEGSRSASLQKRIAESAFMVKRGQGIDPDAIPEAEQLEVVDLIWNAPEADVLSIGEIFQFEREWEPEIMGFVPCAACHELTARAYLRVVGEKHVCIPCSGYER